MFSVLKNQVNVTDISNKPSVSFFFTTKVAKKNSGVGSCCSRQNHYMNCNFAVVKEILFDLHHLIARFAWLIQEYLFLVKK